MIAKTRSEPALAGRLRALTGRLTSVRADPALRGGAALADLVRDVEQCCLAATGLTGAESTRLRPQLLGLLDELGRLDGSLTQDRAAVAEQLKDLARFGGARSAYAQRAGARQR